MASPFYACKCTKLAFPVNGFGAVNTPTFSTAEEKYKTHPSMHQNGSAALVGPIGGLYIARAYAAFGVVAMTDFNLSIYDHVADVVLEGLLGQAPWLTPTNAPGVLNVSAMIASVGAPQVSVRLSFPTSGTPPCDITLSLRRVADL